MRATWLQRTVKVLAFATLILGFFFTVFAGIRPQRYQPPKVPRPVVFEKLASNSKIGESAHKFDAAVANIAQKSNLQLCETADWLTICRRLSLALLGSGLSLQDIRYLETLPEGERVNVFLESCLIDPRWSNYWSERFTRAFVGNDNGPFLLYRRRKFRLWLAEQFRREVGYDQIVSTMIAAKGLWTDRPEVNFYTATADGDEDGRADPIRIAGRASRVFLAKRIDCLQCHDDFIGNVNFAADGTTRPGTQADFHKLASFFDGASMKNPLAGLQDDGRAYQTTLLGQTSPTAIAPSVPFEPELFDASLPRRDAFASWLTDTKNKHFARATVNRVWALMVGRPLVAPVDDIADDATMIQPLDVLANQFGENGFDLKQLIRTIVTTETFCRQSKSETFEITPEHEKVFASFPISRLRPEQIAYSVFQATTLTRLSDESNVFAQLSRNDELTKFMNDFGDLGDSELSGIPPTVTQRLLLLNGSASYAATQNDPVANAASRIGTFAADEIEIMNQIYLSFLNRYPTQSERETLLNEFFAPKVATDKATDASPNSNVELACDLAYSLMNSAEMQWNH